MWENWPGHEPAVGWSTIDYRSTCSIPPSFTVLDEAPLPALPEQAVGQLDHDVVGRKPGVVGVLGQALLAGGAGGEELDLTRRPDPRR